jgi:hypothetical protein
MLCEYGRLLLSWPIATNRCSADLSHGLQTPAVVRLYGDEGESTDFIVGEIDRHTLYEHLLRNVCLPDHQEGGSLCIPVIAQSIFIALRVASDGM